MPIVATKSGWLFAATILRETPKHFVVEYKDEKGKEKWIKKSDKKMKIFDNTDEAIDWINEDI